MWALNWKERGTMDKNRAVIGIGTNLGNREENLKNSIDALNLLPNTKVTKVSKIYETEPWGYAEQDNFLNCCMLIETELSPHALLGACLGIEAALKRVRTIKNGPRTADLDILLYENVTENTEELKIPHPLMQERAFVLVPLNDLKVQSICPFDIDEALGKISSEGVNFFKDN